MSDNNWPFNPDHITNDGPFAKPDDVESLKFSFLSDQYRKTSKRHREKLKKLTGTGIISNAYLEGLQTTICANLGNPTTFVEFSPNGDPVRTDSRLLPSSMHEPCKLFRYYTDEKLCLECDNWYAKLFYRLSLNDDLIGNVQKKLKCCDFISNDRQKRLHCEIISDPRRPYLEYDCSLLGYRELVFPIFFEENVIAVFFVGQLCLRSQLNKILEHQEAFFNKPNALLLECCTDVYARNKLTEAVTKAHANYVKINSNIMEEEDYKEFISKAIKELEGFEAILDQQMNIRRDRYIREHIDKNIKEFSYKLQNRPVSGEEKWQLLWQNTNERLEQIVQEFALQYIVVFANRSFETASASFLDIVSQAGTLPQKLKELANSKEIKYDLTKIPSGIRYQWTTSIEEPRLFSGIISDQMAFERKYNLIRIFPVPFFPDATLVVLVGYLKENPLNSVKNRPYEQLRVASQTFYALILSTFSATLSSIADEKRQKALGLLTHELKVPLVAIRGATQMMLDTPRAKQFFEFDYIGDVESWSDLMSRLIDNADLIRYSTKSLPIEPTLTHLLPGVIAPAIKHVRFLLEERGFSKNKITYKGFESLPSLWISRNQFQQVMFNLLSNAIKYSFDNPLEFKVEIEAKERGQQFMIWFRDWGPGIEEGMEEKIFDEEVRGKSVIKMNITGQGLGLWVVRRIIERHGGKIRLSNSYWPTEFEISLPYMLTSRGPI